MSRDRAVLPKDLQISTIWKQPTKNLCLASTGGKIEGDVRINGHPKEQNSFARVSGYVEQFDTHSAAATVHEALMFSGILRNEKNIDRDTTEAFVDQVRMTALLEWANDETYEVHTVQVLYTRQIIRL